MLLPPVLRMVGRVFSRSAAAVPSRGNAMRHPEPSTRSAISLVIGVTLVTMFSVAAACFNAQAGAVAATAGPQQAASDGAYVALVLGVLGVLIGFSLAIAAVGPVSRLSLSVLERRREIGLLRAVGLDRRQVRLMVLFESLRLTLAGGLCGLVLGVLCGWTNALRALSSEHRIDGCFLPTVPVVLVLAVVGLSAVLAVVASLVPTRRANAVSPVATLAVDGRYRRVRVGGGDARDRGGWKATAHRLRVVTTVTARVQYCA